MKISKKVFIISICITVIVSVLITLAVLYGFQWLPKGSPFSFDTLGVFLGAVGSVGAIAIILFTTKKQLSEQRELQKQNIRLGLYDKRIQFYYKINKLLNEFAGIGLEKNWDMYHYISEVYLESKLVFESDIVEYIGEIAEKIRQYLSIYIDVSKEGHPAKPDDEFTEQENKIMLEIFFWIDEQIDDILFDKFKKYLEIKRYGLEE